MTYAVDLTSGVALFAQPNDHYCGPASARMVRNGYPNPPGGALFEQDDLWNRIQAKNSQKAADKSQNWYTDPQGMQDTLRSLASPPVVSWNVVAGSRAGTLLAALVSLKSNRYPIPMLVNQGDHWIVLTGFVTDVEPVDGGAPKLSKVCLQNPWPIGAGATETLTASEFAGTHYFGQSVAKTGTWRYKYVCVAERPVHGTVAIAGAGKPVGRRRLAPAAARTRALAAIGAGSYIPCDGVSAFASVGTQAGPAMLVRPATSTGGVAASGAYYLIPVAAPGVAATRAGDGEVAGALLVSESGEMRASVAFGRPLAFISQAQAIDIVARALGAPASARSAEAKLLFRPSRVSMSKAWPFWRVRLGSRTLYVDQNGIIHPRLEAPRPGA